MDEPQITAQQRSNSHTLKSTMVLIKSRATLAAYVVCVLLLTKAAGGSTKIAYKKSLDGKTNVIKEKSVEVTKQPLKQETTKEMENATTTIATVVEETTAAAATDVVPAQQQEHIQMIATNGHFIKITTELPRATDFADETDTNFIANLENGQKEELSDNDTETNEADLSAAKATTTESNRQVPCTCGIFLSSQIQRGTNEPTESKPAILNELDRTFPCTAIGQKQCQTKCLETIVQHLPNSANILCASLERDCRKERAHLFIKNCHNQWWNTNLSAGREYCCKNGQPYQCPLL